MKQFALSLAVLVSAATVFAHEPLNPNAVYYRGQQPTSLIGDVVDCYVEAAYSADGSSADIRALIVDPHGDELVGAGPVLASYDALQGGYSYKTNDADAFVAEILLTATTVKNAEDMSIVVQDHGHFHALGCNDLNGVKDAELSTVQEMFEHFDEYVEDEDHDHENHDH